MISDLAGALLLEMLRFNLGGQFMWLIFIAFMGFFLRLVLRGPGDAWVQSAPSTLLSMGVLGTFAGIVVGLSGFNASNIDDRIGDVLAGLSTAFYSSLLAMALSLVFKLVQVSSFQKLRDSESADVSDDIAEKLLIETANGVKQLRQLNVNAREHSEYLIHITNAVADASDSSGMLGQMSVQRQLVGEGMAALVAEMSRLREQGNATVEAITLLQQQQQKFMDQRQLSERDLRSYIDGLQQILMTLPNRRDFRALGSIITDLHIPVGNPSARQGV